MGLFGPDLDINKSDSEMLSSVYAPPLSLETGTESKSDNEEDTDWSDDMPEDKEEDVDEDEDDEEIPDLKSDDKSDDNITFGGISRKELRRMQEELKWQEGDVENPNQMDLRVGRIVEIVQHDSDDQVFISEVDIGTYDESRLVATSLKSGYKLDDLKKKLVVILCNVTPLDDREVKSKTGMLLLATKVELDEKGEEIREHLELWKPWDTAEPGERIYVEGFPLDDPVPTKEEQYFDFVMKDFLVDSNSEVKWRGLPLKIENHPHANVTVASLTDTYCKLD